MGLGEAFAFLSGLYFRGKLTYALAFARPPAGVPACWVITPNLGLVPADAPTSVAQLVAFGAVPVDPNDPRYCEPLVRSTRKLAETLPAQCEVIFLGSVSTRRYTGPLLTVLGERLRFPIEFIGRGDMSRAGLLLRCAADGQELAYGAIPNGVVRGARPPKLPPRVGLLAEASKPPPFARRTHRKP